MSHHPLPVHASVEVDATPDVVWQAVSDVTRMPQWSPECRRVVVLGSPRSGRGTRFVGLNRRGWAVWPTLSRVVAYEPGRRIAWKVRESGATWTYEVEPTRTGTRLSARRDLPAYSPMTRLAGPLIGGARSHDEELSAGLRTTLERVRATVEGPAAVRRPDESAVGEQGRTARGSDGSSG